MASNSLTKYAHLVLFLLHVLSSANSASVPAIYAFGDSLADVGNNDYLKLSVLKADFPHNGVDYPGGKATGRFSNGKNSADFLADKVGVPTSPPYLSIPSNSNRTQAFLSGVSFASGGAGVLDSTNSGQCLTFNKQIDYFTTVYTELVQELGSAQAQDHLSKSIFSFIIGSNDILSYIRSSDGMTPQQLVDSMITTLRGQLKTIYNLGARKFAFVGTGPIGCCPSLRRKNGSDSCNSLANSISLLYAQGSASLLKDMQSELSGFNYSFFNSTITLLQYLQDPSNYGFTEVKAACCGLGNLNAKVACLPVSKLCQKRSDFVFWDLFHPTEKTAGLLADTIFDGSSPFVYPINVKQLSNL
ncbi:GDSL esterase/lipase At5g55050-like [Asparagus officinalis]|uniref:GDSL esterase/lipase At5g55050-like n=1 Tax=Asparagus officinalis TaxID=4686 RepID=UPI00098DFCC5|nr:GDSL esterase/lipase At5g55050-like [Asparagus officinalis]